MEKETEKRISEIEGEGELSSKEMLNQFTREFLKCVQSRLSSQE